MTEIIVLVLLAFCKAGSVVAFCAFLGFDPIGERREKNMREKYKFDEDEDDDEWSL